MKSLELFARELNKDIEKLLLAEHEFSKNSSPVINEFIQNIITNALSGGKRSRGAFVYYAYLACGGKDLEEIKKVSVGMELIHTFLLIHDDIQDKAKTRRGIPTIHEQYKNLFSSKFKNSNLDDSTDFGNSIALNAGDMLNQLALKIINSSNFDPEYKQKAIDFLLRRIMDVTYGQTLDIFSSFTESISEKDILEIYKYKTAFYTYEAPLHLGAILAGASEDQLNALSAYSNYGGIAFQVQDDILGIFETESKTGKTGNQDILEGKKTLLIAKAIENATEEQKLFINKILGNKEATEEDFIKFREILEDTGALEYCEKLVADYLKMATSNLQGVTTWEKEGSDFLVEINDYMAKRRI